MQIEVIVVGPIFENTRLLICEKTKEAVLIDPGDEADRIKQKIDNLQITLKYIFATHGHVDHIGAVAPLKKMFNVPFYIHKGDEGLVKRIPLQASLVGMNKVEVPQIDKYIEDNDIFMFGKLHMKAVHTPGHSPGSISFLVNGKAFVGDVLFSGGVGRTDLYGGDFNTLQKSIKEKLYTLPDATLVYPGHGPTTTIGHEKVNNPFIRA